MSSTNYVKGAKSNRAERSERERFAAQTSISIQRNDLQRKPVALSTSLAHRAFGALSGQPLNAVSALGDEMFFFAGLDTD